MLHYVVWLVVPSFLLGFTGVLLNFIAWNFVLGAYLLMIFLINHVGAPVVYPDEKLPWVVQQISTSRNLAGHWLVDWIFGGLNAQIEHHVLSTVPSPNLRRARPIVKEFCIEYSIPYYEVGYVHALKEVQAHLKKMALISGKMP